MANYSIFAGANRTLAQLKRAQFALPNQFEAALYAEGQIEVTECKKNTPVLTGALRAGIHLEGPFRDWRRVWVVIATDTETEAYAWFVHEDLEAFHKVGEAKYIERPLNEAIPYLPERIAKRINLKEAFA